MDGDLSLSQSFGGLRIANPDEDRRDTNRLLYRAIRRRSHMGLQKRTT
jgi:hypothetical protein